jgi:hypothetical protein
MKINEITEGFGDFGRYLGAAFAKQIGANNAAEYILAGINKVAPDEPQFFKNTDKVDKVISALTTMQNTRNKRLSKDEIREIIAKTLPSAWSAETNKAGILDAFMSELGKAPLTPSAGVKGLPKGNVAKPAVQKVSTWKMGDPIPQPDGTMITTADGPLYQKVAAQLQNT